MTSLAALPVDCPEPWGWNTLAFGPGFMPFSFTEPNGTGALIRGRNPSEVYRFRLLSGAYDERLASVTIEYERVP